uniref:Uncharacterized protein n=1 Tax=Steinernema glaseri TaxID=37863 RepID=A0A1I7YZR2_9BILA
MWTQLDDQNHHHFLLKIATRNGGITGNTRSCSLELNSAEQLEFCKLKVFTCCRLRRDTLCLRPSFVLKCRISGLASACVLDRFASSYASGKTLVMIQDASRSFSRFL